ncbi:hypothetical protein F2P56_009493 [Juglans regia]|uniref:Derlin n=1 Tax=Juglans regia TaxID=51240 RepID=A0A834CWJ0_JUGRE|nr:hypothetical protein F2P56_009493 [Juglans regia]
MAQAVEEWYKQMPVITRSYLTAVIVTTVGCSLDIISPYKLYLNPVLVVKQYQFWRLITNFLYFRKMGFHTILYDEDEVARSYPREEILKERLLVELVCRKRHGCGL